MKMFFALIATMIVAFTSFAQIPTGPDELGVYFDEEGTSVSITGSIWNYVNAYLILKNPSASGSLANWSCVVSPNWDIPGAYNAEVYGDPRVGVNNHSSMPGEMNAYFSVTTEGFEPQLFEPIMILANLSVDLGYYISPVGLFLPYQPYYSSVGIDGPYISFNPSSGNENLPVAMINGAAPVKTSDQTWDGVKALYR